MAWRMSPAALAASARGARRKGALLTAGSFAFPVLLFAFALSRSYPLSLVLLAAIGFAFERREISSRVSGPRR